MTESKVIQLPTVFGSLLPHETWAKVPAQSGPYTGANVLDATYGMAERFPREMRPCSCGSFEVADDPRVVARCGLCSRDELAGYLIVQDEDLPQEFTAKLGHDRFEFYANHWWKLDWNGDRDHVVRNRDRLAKLDKVSGRLRRLGKMAKPLDTPKPFELWTLRRGRLYRRPTDVEPACHCENEDTHDAYGLDGTWCPRHGETCDTCGDNHFSG